MSESTAKSGDAGSPSGFRTFCQCLLGLVFLAWWFGFVSISGEGEEREIEVFLYSDENTQAPDRKEIIAVVQGVVKEFNDSKLGRKNFIFDPETNVHEYKGGLVPFLGYARQGNFAAISTHLAITGKTTGSIKVFVTTAKHPDGLWGHANNFMNIVALYGVNQTGADVANTLAHELGHLYIQHSPVQGAIMQKYGHGHSWDADPKFIKALRDRTASQWFPWKPVGVVDWVLKKVESVKELHSGKGLSPSGSEENSEEDSKEEGREDEPH